MVTNTVSVNAAQAELVLRACIETLRKVASYRLPHVLDQRLLWLSENKECLDENERAELAALVEFSDDRSLGKAQARAALEQLNRVYPELAGKQA
jgi:hypothetical protein